MEIQKLTAVSLGKKIKEKEISVREALDAVFAQIDQTEGRYHAYVTLDKEGAYKQADVVQEKIDKGELTGALAGVPVAIKDELQHSRSYMNIQLARYKERFKTEFRIDKEIENYCIVKLVIQPILENAIYYGVGNMDEDDDGMIIVTGEKRDEDILITIEDNGMGMREEVLENILTDSSKVPKHGSGVGVINVHSRIRLMFGEEYGLFIESEPDEGTKVTIRIPAIPYTPENAETLELQKYMQRRQADEKE